MPIWLLLPTIKDWFCVLVHTYSTVLGVWYVFSILKPFFPRVDPGSLRVSFSCCEFWSLPRSHEHTRAAEIYGERFFFCLASIACRRNKTLRERDDRRFISHSFCTHSKQLKLSSGTFFSSFHPFTSHKQNRKKSSLVYALCRWSLSLSLQRGREKTWAKLQWYNMSPTNIMPEGFLFKLLVCSVHYRT